ncbi:hypothetical protein BV898_17246 [Hypsibius exemplaris]|uniref:Uncharacterized protein n=1 Tax=Hypsibius exemplaris TaxID=2072580 RepID=A0A9X6RLU8_HYPEX|nr:hypothetical protein BV898_17246 [Hypsibius exemplaris]
MAGRMQPIRQPTPILIGGANNNGPRQTSSDSDWGDVDENDLVNWAEDQEKEYFQSQAAASGASGQGPPGIVIRQNIPLPISYSSGVPKQGVAPIRGHFQHGQGVMRHPQAGLGMRASQGGSVSGPQPGRPVLGALRPHGPHTGNQRAPVPQMGSQVQGRVVPIASQQPNCVLDPQVLLRENAALKEKNTNMEYARQGEVKMLREQLARKEEDMATLRRELEMTKSTQLQQQATQLAETKKRLEQAETDLKFKEQEEISRREHLESGRQTPMTHLPGGSQSTTPLIGQQKRAAVAHPDGFPTMQTFGGQNPNKRARRTVEPQPAETFPLGKTDRFPIFTTSTAIQTDPVMEVARSVDGPGMDAFEKMEVGEEDAAGREEDAAGRECRRLSKFPVASEETHFRSYEVIHALNDSRPGVEERFTLPVLLQPLPKFQVSSTYEWDLEKKKQLDKELSRSGRLSKRAIKGVMQDFLNNSSPAAWIYPSHLVAQEAIALFVTLDKKTGCVSDEKPRYSFLLTAIIPVLTNHLRQYASFLHNLSSLAGSTARTHVPEALLTSPDGELHLVAYFTTVLTNPSMAALRFVETIERNTKLSLIVLRKLLDLYPEVHSIVMRDMDSPQQVYTDLANMFTELKPLEEGIHHGALVPLCGDKQLAGFRQDGSAIVPRRDNSSLWRNVGDKLSAKYRMDQKTQEEAMMQLVQIPEPMTKISALKLILMLSDPLQFRISQRSVLSLSASALASLAASVAPDSLEAKEMGERMIVDEVLLNYFSAADTRETLEPAVRLLRVLLQWTFFLPRLCDGTPEPCLLDSLYQNVFACDHLPKQRVLENGSLHHQLLDSLLYLIMSADVEAKLLLICPSRDCVETLLQHFLETLYVNVELISTAKMCSTEEVEVAPSVQQFIINGVMWLYALKEQTDEESWKNRLHVVKHRFHSVVVSLHDENLFDYQLVQNDFGIILDALYEGLSNQTEEP